MKWQRFLSLLFYPFILYFLALTGCSRPILKMPKSLPPIIKEYKHMTIHGDWPGMQNTGVYLDKGDIYALLGTGEIDAWPSNPNKYRGLVRPGNRTIGRIGKNPYFGIGTFLFNGYASYAYRSGYLYLGIKDGAHDRYGGALNPEYFKDNVGSIRVDIIVWEREDWVEITDFFTEMRKLDPENEIIENAFIYAEKRKELYLAELKASNEIEQTKKEIQKLKDEPDLKVDDAEPYKEKQKSKKEGPDKVIEKEETVTATRPIREEVSKNQKIAQLEAKLSKLAEVLAELDKLKKELSDERLKADQLSEKLSSATKEKEALKEKAIIDDEVKKQLDEERKRTELLSKRLNEITEEKEKLKKKLDNEVDLKNALETSLKERESTSKIHENLKSALYEKERQLKSTSFQLDDTVRKSKETRDKLARLLEREQELSKLLKQKETQKETVSGKYQAELEDLQAAKKTLESEADTLRSRETKLLNEMESLKELAKKTKNEADIAKHELEDMRKREAQLIGQLNEMKEKLDKGAAPVVVVSQPKNGSKLEIPTTVLHLVAVDDRGIQSIRASINGKPITLENTRGQGKSSRVSPKAIKKLDLSARLKLEYGENIISVSVKDTDGTYTKESIKVTRVKSKGKIWAAIIGINQYPHTRNLKFAVNDALGFKNYLEEYIGIPKENLFYLTDQHATKYEIESLLGTKLKRKASKDDTVFIFYAGHGAVETDPVDPDGDGFEKYLLPYDARLDDLYTTAISMNDVRTIFQRNRAQRLVFIADTCYSGASGGRSMLTSKTRATLSDQFFERVSKGKGRVIISACSANEVSQEDDRLKHGIFSYYLLEGLKGKSDINGDNVITISELFSYLSRKVPEASGQDQHPVKKGETEGELVIGYVK